MDLFVKAKELVVILFVVGMFASAQGEIVLPGDWQEPSEGYEVVFIADNNELPDDDYYTGVQAWYSTYGTSPSIPYAEITTDGTDTVLLLDNGDTGSAASGYYRNTANTGSASDEITIDMRFKLLESLDSSPQFMILVRRPANASQSPDTEQYLVLTLGSGSSGATLGNLGNDWHDIRVTVDCNEGAYTVYLDGSESYTVRGAMSTRVGSLNYVIFGDGGSSVYGSAEVDYFAFTNSEIASTLSADSNDLGLMLNDDGVSFLEGRSAYYGRTATEMLYDVDDTIESMVGTNVDCFMFCVALGSENTYYPTNVPGGAPIGWQFGTFDPQDTDTWANVSVVDYARAWLTVTPDDKAVHPEDPNGPMDIVYYIAKRAKARGLNFFPSIRINDAHFASSPWWDTLMDDGTPYAGETSETLPATGNWAPTTGKFWVNHNGNPAGEEDGILDNNRLDFAVQSVRDYRMDMIHEVLERYRNQISGIELDLTRHGICFSETNDPNNMALMTVMIKEVRQHLDDLERRTGTTKYLVIRVLPSLENSEMVNHEIDAWLQTQDVTQYHWSNTDPFAAPTAYPNDPNQAVYSERLVDVVIPEQLYALASDMPIYDDFSGDTSDDYLNLANGAMICPTIYERSHWSWPFVTDPNSNDYAADKANQRPSPELVAGAASNYWAMGCDGFQMYNYHLPLDEQMSGEPAGAFPLGETVVAMLDAEASLDGQNRIYEVQPASSATSDIYNSATYYNTSLYNYQKQMPRILSDGVEETLNMYIGDFDSVTPESVELRLGLVMTSSGDPNYDDSFSDQSATIIIKIGNTRIVSDNLSDYLLVTGKDVSGNPAVSVGYPSVSRAYFQVPIARPARVLNQASENTIKIEISDNTTPFALVELQIGVFY